MTDLSALHSTSAVVVAAGQSRRMGRANKLLLSFEGMPVIARVVATLCQSGLPQIFVVTGHEHEAIAAVLADHPVHLVYNPHFSEGMAASIRIGIRHAGAGQCYLLCLGDMPLIQATTYHEVAQACAHQSAIVQPTYQGRPGHPVAFGSTYYDALLTLSGDRGARSLLQAVASNVRQIAVSDPGIHLDVDTPEQFATTLAQADPTVR